MSSDMQKLTGFDGLRVAAFESRHTQAMAQLITNYEGKPLVAPAMREIPREENKAAFDFARELLTGQFDLVIFLTGVGTRLLTKIIETRYPRAQWIEALCRTTIAARGPKPIAALSELGVPIHVKAPEPNTWRELVNELDDYKEIAPWVGRRIAIQEYGLSNAELIRALVARGAEVCPVPIYQWGLPLDTGPLRNVTTQISRGRAQVALFTTSVQVVHLMQIAAEMKLELQLRHSFDRMVVGSIGPTTSDMLKEYGLPVDMEPSHPKMGVLVKEAAELSRELLNKKINLRQLEAVRSSRDR